MKTLSLPYTLFIGFILGLTAPAALGGATNWRFWLYLAICGMISEVIIIYIKTWFENRKQ